MIKDDPWFESVLAGFDFVSDPAERLKFASQHHRAIIIRRLRPSNLQRRSFYVNAAAAAYHSGDSVRQHQYENLMRQACGKKPRLVGECFRDLLRLCHPSR